MKKYTITVLLLCFTVFIADAQTKKRSLQGARFSTIVQAGLLEGEANKPAAQLQVVSGIQRAAWFFGLGVGIDHYGPKRSVPLFIDVRRDLRTDRSTPFLYADAGYNFSWLRNKDKLAFWGTDYQQKGGAYYDAGLGYKFRINNTTAIGISAGYSFKQQQELYTRTQFFIPPVPGFKQPPDVYDYKFRRISLKLACSF